MTSNHIKCENEPIHLVKAIQSFGKLIIVDIDFNLIAYSKNTEEWLMLPSLAGPRTSISPTFTQLFPNSISAIQAYLELVRDNPTRPQTSKISHEDKLYRLNIYAVEDYIFIEFEEEKVGHKKDDHDLYQYTKEINNAHCVWTALAESIREIITFDRVMIYQFLEDKSGKVVAESKEHKSSSYLGLRYPESDIPAQARALYLRKHARQVWDTEAASSPLLSDGSVDFDLSLSSLRALSPIHIQYLQNAGARASMSFSILVHGVLWGLVTCQHAEAKHTDYNERGLCLILIEFAVNRYLTQQKEIEIQLNKKVTDFELGLKDRVILENNLMRALESKLEPLANLINADGICILHKDEEIRHGLVPSSAELQVIQQYIDARSVKPIFRDHTFLSRRAQDFDFPLSFAGLLRVDMDGSGNFYLYCFRKEYVFEETWAGNPAKTMRYSEAENLFYPSPRESFATWKATIHGSSIKWGKQEIFFLRRIRQIIINSILSKSQEIERLNKDLILLNNALETYSYTVTHDLKNPLSSIKLTAQFLNHRKEQTLQSVSKATNNILDAVESMENIMEKTLEFSRAKVYSFAPEKVDICATIHSIVDHCAQKYKFPTQGIDIGQLLPIYGEKTLLYQVFSNVISNAVKYSSKAQQPNVAINSYLSGSQTVYEIKDNGIGISKEELSTVFEVFRRMSNSSDFEGSGVGLAIVKRIVERLNGEIDVQSELNRGTTVKILFCNQNEAPVAT